MTGLLFFEIPRFRWLILIAAGRLRTVGDSLVVILRYHIFGEIVRTAGPEHERVHADAHVLAFGFDAFPYEHAGTLDAVYCTGLRINLEAVVTRTGACLRYPICEDQ